MTKRAIGPFANGYRRLGGALITVLTVTGCLVSVVGGAPAGAAISTVGGGCGFHLGAPVEQAAAGTFGFEFPVYPANPHQVCSVAVPVSASIARVGGGSFTNVSGNPSTQTVTLNFTGGPLPLGILWLWSPHCADPAAPAVFTLTVDGESAPSTTQPATSCSPDFGGSSRLFLNSLEPADANTAVGMAPTTNGHGYWTVVAGGDEVNVRGNATASGFLVGLVKPVVGIVADPTGHGYWVVSADGGVFSFGGAAFHGSLGNVHLNAPIVGVAATPNGGGYWLVAADGGVFTFGNAAFHGSLGNVHLNAPIVGVAATPNGGGYWLVAADGGVFTFGNAAFHGSLGNVHLNAPIVGVAATPNGGGYWLAAYDGGVFTFGNAPFAGSAGNVSLAAPVFAIARTPSGHGYWLLGGDGGIFTFGDAGFYGSAGAPI